MIFEAWGNLLFDWVAHLFKIQIDKPAQVEDLQDAATYQKQVADEAH